MLANATGSRAPTSACVSGLVGSAIVTIHGAPMNRRVNTCHSRIMASRIRSSIRVDGSNPRLNKMRYGRRSMASVAGEFGVVAAVFLASARGKHEENQYRAQAEGKAATLRAAQGVFQGSLAIHGMISHVAIPW